MGTTLSTRFLDFTIVNLGPVRRMVKSKYFFALVLHLELTRPRARAQDRF